MVGDIFRDELFLVDEDPHATSAVLEVIEDFGCSLPLCRLCAFGQEVLLFPDKLFHPEVLSHGSADLAPAHVTCTCELGHRGPRICLYRPL